MYNPSATVAGLSEYLWELEQPAHAVANQYFVAAINRVGIEKPWKIGEFYGKSYFCNPRGKIVAQASRDKDELLVADLNLDEIQEVRDTWQFYRDRRPETYGEITRTIARKAPRPRTNLATNGESNGYGVTTSKPAAISSRASGWNPAHAQRRSAEIPPI